MACPSWCASEHPPGGVHRVEVGRVFLGDKTLLVVILKSPYGDPAVTISGSLYVAVSPDDYEDMAALLELSGQAELAGLVRRAAEILAGAERAEVA